MSDKPTPQAFVHVATPKNTQFNYTYIDNELTNNNPNALVFVTQRWYPNQSSQRGIYNDHPIGVWYDNDKWSIYNQRNPRDTHTSDERDKIPQMPIGAAFNVWIYQETLTDIENKTNNKAATHLDATPDPKQAQTSKNRLFIILFYLILPLLMLWLVGGIILYFQRSVNMTHLQNMFMLWDYPFVSFGLLLLGLITFLMCIDDHWRKLFAWFGSLDPLNRPLQAAILLSIAFFATLLVMAMIFPAMTGYSFKSDWSLLLVATIPMLALIALILINKYQTLSLEGAGFKFTGAVTTPESDPTQMLHITLEEKNIELTVDQMKAGKIASEARNLVVSIDPKMSLEFSMLQNSVREISTMAPIRYIVFLNEAKKYLGFIPLEDFMLPGGGVPQITEWNLKQLGVSKLSFTKPTGKSLEKQDLMEAYRQMMQNNLPGIPVLDEHAEFKSMLERDRIEQAVVMYFLEQSTKKT